MRIVFIRHGQTKSNVGHLLDTAYPGAPLNEVGLAQAAGLPARLEGVPIEVVMTSDITRARQTGEPLARALRVPLITHPGVREIYAGDWEMDTDWRQYVAVIEAWTEDPSRSLPGGDSGEKFFARFDAAIAELADYQCAAVVSHGGALRCWLGRRCGIELDADRSWHLDNTDTVVVEGVPGDWTIINWAGRDIDSAGVTQDRAEAGSQQ